MKYTVDPADLQAASRQLRRSTAELLQVPAAVRAALMAVDPACGDEGCGAAAFNLATRWQLALGVLVDTGAGLADSIGTAGGAYSHNEEIVLQMYRATR